MRPNGRKLEFVDCWILLLLKTTRLLSRLESISGNCMMSIAREHKFIRFYGWNRVTDLIKWELGLEKCPRSLLKPWSEHQFRKKLELNDGCQVLFCWKNIRRNLSFSLILLQQKTDIPSEMSIYASIPGLVCKALSSGKKSQGSLSQKSTFFSS